VTTQAQRDYNVRAVRAFARRLRGLAAGDLPPIPYCHDWWWRDFVLETPPDRFWSRLALHSKARAGRGLLRSPELVATMYRWQYPTDALRMFVGEALGRGEMPDAHALWLLLHPEQIPLDFPMYLEAR
jgi:hypothetical protein